MDDTDREQAQKLIREVVIILSELSEIERRFGEIKKQAKALYDKLNNASEVTNGNR